MPRIIPLVLGFTFAVMNGCPSRGGESDPSSDAGEVPMDGATGDAATDASESDGSESDLCTLTCAPPNAVAICVGHECTIDRCEAGFLDCAGGVEDGCELAADADPEHCGACNTVCEDCVTEQLIAVTARPAPLDAPVSPNCSASMPVCCPGGVAGAPCGPIELDFAPQEGDAPRFSSTLVPPGGVDVVLRARVTSSAPIPFSLAETPCTFTIDTTLGAEPDIQIQIGYVATYEDGQSRVAHTDVSIAGLGASDVIVGGAYACQLLDGNSVVVVAYEAIQTAAVAALALEICAACPCS